MKHLKIKIMSIALLAAATSSMAQSLDKMNWLNEPQQWEIKEGKTLVMDVPAKTDFWRVSHYGFTVDDGPFYYATYGGEFEVKGKITGNYVTTFDQMGRVRRRQTECKCRSHPPHQRLECSATAGCSSFFMD